MAFLKAIKTRQIKKCIQHKKRILFQSVIKGVVRVKERSLCLLCSLAQCLHRAGKRCPGVELLPFEFKGQSRPLKGNRAGAEAFSFK